MRLPKVKRRRAARSARTSSSRSARKSPLPWARLELEAMATITAQMVKELRERTGLGMMDCKKALTEADGDFERAAEELAKSSAAKSQKKACRTAADGLLGIKISPDGKRGAMVEVNIETDFAARNEKFIAF